MHGGRLDHQPLSLFGLVHVQLGCSIDNTDSYECLSPNKDREGHRRAGAEWGLLNAPLREEGCLATPAVPGWGAVGRRIWSRRSPSRSISGRRTGEVRTHVKG